MHNVRKALASATAAALVSAAISMNRYRLNRLLHTRQRHRSIDALKRQYDNKLDSLRRRADVGASIFMTLRYQAFLDMTREAGLPEVEANTLFTQWQQWARETIYRELAPKLTIAYAKQLYPLDPKLADEKNQDAQDDLVDARDFSDRMVKAGFPVRALLDTLHRA